jgi:hypothetical protein
VTEPETDPSGKVKEQGTRGPPSVKTIDGLVVIGGPEPFGLSIVSRRDALDGCAGGTRASAPGLRRPIGGAHGVTRPTLPRLVPGAGARVLPNERAGPEEIFWHPFGVRSLFCIHRGSSLRCDPRLLSFNPPG